MAPLEGVPVPVMSASASTIAVAPSPRAWPWPSGPSASGTRLPPEHIGRGETQTSKATQ